MNYFEKGLEEDIKRNIIEAISFYEQSISIGENVPEAYINLLVIHWLIIYDNGFYTSLGISKNNYVYTDDRYEYFLKLGKEKFPSNS